MSNKIIDISKAGSMESKLENLHKIIKDTFPDAETVNLRYHIKGGVEATPIYFVNFPVSDTTKN